MGFIMTLRKRNGRPKGALSHEPIREPDYAVDYGGLCIKEYGHRKPMYAFGGAILSPKIILKLEDQLVLSFFITPILTVDL